MELGLTHRSAIVSGATSGLGLAIAGALVAEGADIAICGRDRDRLEGALATLRERATGRVIGDTVDVTDQAQVQAWVAASAAELGGLHVVVTNAGGPPKGRATDFDLDDYRNAVEINMLSAIGMIHAALPHLHDAGWGRIVIVGSRTVREPNPDLALSNAARAGLLGYMKSLVRDLGPSAITVNMLAPGSVLTERMAGRMERPPSSDELEAAVPLGRFGAPEELAAAAAFLASDPAGFITGVVLPVDGGSIHGL